MPVIEITYAEGSTYSSNAEWKKSLFCSRMQYKNLHSERLTLNVNKYLLVCVLALGRRGGSEI